MHTLRFLLQWQVESEDVVFTLETIVEKFGEEMAPFAVGLCQHLTQAFWRLQVRPLTSHCFLRHFGVRDACSEMLQKVVVKKWH